MIEDDVREQLKARLKIRKAEAMAAAEAARIAKEEARQAAPAATKAKPADAATPPPKRGRPRKDSYPVAFSSGSFRQDPAFLDEPDQDRVESGQIVARGEPKSATDLAYRLALLGLTSTEASVVFGVASSTFYRWMHEYSDFREAWTRGTDEAGTGRVQQTLLGRATGCETIERVFELRPVVAPDNKNATPRVEMVMTKEIRKTVPPDTTAAIFWLCNRAKDRWRHVSTVQVDAGLDKLAAPEAFLAEYLAALRRQALPLAVQDKETTVQRLKEEVEALLAPPEFLSTTTQHNGKLND